MVGYAAVVQLLCLKLLSAFVCAMDQINKPLTAPGQNKDQELVLGPSFKEAADTGDLWRDFLSQVDDPLALPFAELWGKKACAVDGVPLRKDFDFKELVKFGSNMCIAKLTNDGRWLTTFCGDAIVERIDMELTGKHIDEFADPDTLPFWEQSCHHLSDDCRPVIEKYNLDFAEKTYTRVTSVNLPLKSSKKLDFADMHIEVVGFQVKENPDHPYL